MTTVTTAWPPAGVRNFNSQDWECFQGAEEQPKTATAPARGPYILESDKGPEGWLGVMDRGGLEIWMPTRQNIDDIEMDGQAHLRLELTSLDHGLLLVDLITVDKLAALTQDHLMTLGFQDLT